MNEPPPLPQSNSCSRCGARIQPTANFCHTCGAAVDKLPKSRPKNRPLLATFLALIFIGFTGYIIYTGLHEQPRQASDTTTKPETKAEYDQRVLAEKAEYERRVVAEQQARDRATAPTVDPTLLEVVHSTWKKGGFDAVAIWHVTFLNRSDKPIGNIRYRTRYHAETGDQVDQGGVDVLLGDYTIRKVIPPHQKRTIEINDGFLHHEAVRGSFEVVSWEFVNPP
jgi:hypothetical protein